MLPPPPSLLDVADTWSDKQLFWIVQNGLKYTGMPAWVRKEWDLACATKSAEERAAPFRNLTDLSRRSPKGYIKSGYVGPNQPWGSAENWFALENHRRPQFKPFLQDIEHSAHDILMPEIRRISGLLAVHLLPDVDRRVRGGHAVPKRDAGRDRGRRVGRGRRARRRRFNPGRRRPILRTRSLPLS